jgi:putative membrane protein
MAYSPYAELRQDQLTLRDHLAADRTRLANERTLLSYVRTALALVVIGASAIKFTESIPLIVLGVLFLPIGVATALAGLWRYWTMRHRIDAARNQ